MITVTVYPVGDIPVLVTSEISGTRSVGFINTGLCPVWMGGSDVLVEHGRILWPGEGMAYDQGDELYAIARGNPTGAVTVDERRT